VEDSIKFGRIYCGRRAAIRAVGVERLGWLDENASRGEFGTGEADESLSCTVAYGLRT